MRQLDALFPTNPQHLRNLGCRHRDEATESAMPKTIEGSPGTFVQLCHIGKWKQIGIGAGTRDDQMLEGSDATYLTINMQHFPRQKRRAIRNDYRFCHRARLNWFLRKKDHPLHTAMQPRVNK